MHGNYDTYNTDEIRYSSLNRARLMKRTLYDYYVYGSVIIPSRLIYMCTVHSARLLF